MLDRLQARLCASKKMFHLNVPIIMNNKGLLMLLWVLFKDVFAFCRLLTAVIQPPCIWGKM